MKSLEEDNVMSNHMCELYSLWNNIHSFFPVEYLMTTTEYARHWKIEGWKRWRLIIAEDVESFVLQTAFDLSFVKGVPSWISLKYLVFLSTASYREAMAYKTRMQKFAFFY